MHCNCICLEFYGVEAFRIPLVGKRMPEFGVGCIFIPRAHAYDCPQYPYMRIYILYRETITTLDYEKQ